MIDHAFHTLTVTDAGEIYITEHQGDDTLNLHAGCLVYKIALNAFATRILGAPRDQTTADTPRAADAPAPGVYRITLGDDSNLHIFGRITHHEQETHQ